MKRLPLLAVLIVLPVFLFFSCKKDSTTTPVTDSLLKIAEAVTSNSSFSIKLFSKDSLFVGYNVVYFRLTNNSDGKEITSATLALHPLMDMGTYKHACPVENPSTTANADGYFQGAILFSMPGTDTWSIDVDVTANGKTETAHFSLAKVIALTPARKMVVIDSLETSPGNWVITKYPMSLIYPDAWKVGINPFEFTIHRMESMMSFPPVTDLTVEIDPQMPSMGHGSPNNVNPVHTANGHYKGSANFTMTGDWRIYLTIRKDGRLITDKAYFDITL